MKSRTSTSILDELRKEAEVARVDNLASRLAQDLSGVPKYKRLRPKEARFSSEQLLGLRRIAQLVIDHRINPKAEKVTENTLIRVAVDFLIQHWDLAMLGNDEDELREKFFKSFKRVKH